MKISIIIPTYNRNELLAICLERLSPRSQSLSADEYEVIVSDDSKENTAKPFIQKNFPWAECVKGSQRGPAANRNNGAGQAVGEWLLFIDDDCIPDNNLIKNYLSAINLNKSVFVFEGRIEADRQKRHFLEEAPINKKGGYLWSCNFVINRNFFLEGLNGFDENYPSAAMEDVDLHQRIKQKGYEVKFISDALVIHPWRLQENLLHHTIQRTLSVQYFYNKFPELVNKSSFATRLRSELRFYIKFVGFNIIRFRGRGLLTYIKAHLLNQKTIKGKG